MTLLSALTGIFFVGHSLFGQTNPTMLGQLIAARAGSIPVAAQIINGAPLSYNWTHSASAEGTDGRVALSSGTYNVVILTEAIPLANHLEWSGSAEAALNWHHLATTANPDARVFLQETWHSLNSGTGVEIPYDAGATTPWRARLTQDHAAWAGLVDQINAARSPDSPPVALIEAGQALARLDDAIADGTVPGLSAISDLFSDDIHPNALGFYFISLVQYATITGDSPVGLPHQLSDPWGVAYAAPSDALALRLQQIAHRAVTGTDPPPQAAVVVPAATVRAAPTSHGALAVGLAAIADWSPQAPFLDHMKTARPWIGHRPGQWGGMEYADLQAGGFLDGDGWPVEIPRGIGSIGTLILTDLPPEAMDLAGRYRLQFEGSGIVEAGGRASNQRYGRNEVRFDFTPGPGSVDIRIQRSNRDDPVRAISVVREDHAAAFDAGARFNPDFLARLGGFDALRFMDWMGTNNSRQSAWVDRPRLTDATWSIDGVPVEVMIDLANTVGADAWFNMPHLADDAYVQAFADLTRATLAQDRRAYVEFSNEVWNWQFEQTRWADAEARRIWNAPDAGMQAYAQRASQVADLWSATFAGPDRARLVNVISSQTGWLGLEEIVLSAPLWAHAPVAGHFDAYAITGYFGGILGTQERAPMVRDWLADSAARARAEGRAKGLTGRALEDHVMRHRFDHAADLAGRELRDGAVSGDPTDTLADLIGRTWPYHVEVARGHGLELIMYEGGTHLTGIGALAEDAELTDFFIAFNYSAEMGVLYDILLDGWSALGAGMFTAYSDVYAPTRWGSWGALRHLSDDNPRWRALVAAQ